MTIQTRKLYLGSGCSTVGKAVALEDLGSNLAIGNLNNNIQLRYVNCWNDENKSKEVGNSINLGTNCYCAHFKHSDWLIKNIQPIRLHKSSVV